MHANSPHVAFQLLMRSSAEKAFLCECIKSTLLQSVITKSKCESDVLPSTKSLQSERVSEGVLIRSRNQDSLTYAAGYHNR